MTDTMSVAGAPAPASTGFFASIIAWGKSELTTIEGEAVTLWDTIEPDLISEAESVITQFLGTAIAAVKAQASLLISGEEKFANAKDNVLEAIEADGSSIGNTLLEFLVNLALSLLKTGSGVSLV
ncbi:MAG: hypothetical protein ABSD74_05560 [Rhizomicrobium sp.]|jgi:hypothetical protein